jgi:hypothetical protein
MRNAESDGKLDSRQVAGREVTIQARTLILPRNGQIRAQKRDKLSEYFSFIVCIPRAANDGVDIVVFCQFSQRATA